jgi:hypothetical protein
MRYEARFSKAKFFMRYKMTDIYKANDLLKIAISIPARKAPLYLGTIELTRAELLQHSCHKLALVLNKLTEYILKHAKHDSIILDYIHNLDTAMYTTDDGLKIALLDN